MNKMNESFHLFIITIVNFWYKETTIVKRIKL